MAGAAPQAGPEDAPPDPDTRALDVESIGRAGAVAAWAVAVLGAGASVLLVATGGRAALTGGILLGVAALAALAVGIQATGEPWPGEADYGAGSDRDVEERRAAGGEEREERPRRLPLADRLALGLLGGALGGLAVSAAVWSADAAGLPDLLGVRMSGAVTGTALLLRAWYGALWGLVLGVLFPRLPGRSSVSRCTLFGLAPAVYALVVVYPLVLGLGWFAADLGLLTFVFVVLFHLLWGAVAGGLFRWGETTDLGVLSRPLVRR